MGTRVAPTFANIFIERLENRILSQCPAHLRKLFFTWKRYIDDIFIIFNWIYNQFDELFHYLNSGHEIIKFDTPNHNKEDKSCNFLDLKVSMKQDYTSIQELPKQNYTSTQEKSEKIVIQEKLESIKDNIFPLITLENVKYSKSRLKSKNYLKK